MRILLDESLPRGLKGLLEGHDVVTVPEQGWQSMKNGELLRRTGGAFDVFVTADQNLEHQQNVASLPFAVVVLVATSNRRDAIELYLRHEPTRVSRSRIKRLRGLDRPQYRLRVDEVRVFYDVQENTVQVLAVVSKAQADAWLKAQGTPSKTGGTRDGEG